MKRRREGADAKWKPVRRCERGVATSGRHPFAIIACRSDRSGSVVEDGVSAARSCSAGRGSSLHASPRRQHAADMVRVPAATFNAQYGGIGSLSAQIPEYLIDRHEVTNREFKRFVDAGGYTTRAYWTEPFVDGDRTLSWEDAMRRFVDPTGRPGPATWDSGAYKDGEDDVPVAGVSWYEAAAYAAFAGRTLPTVYHWFRAANTDDSRFLVAVSNFRERARGCRAFQCGWFLRSSRMAGNVREWCWNANRYQRYLLGGSWADPAYMFTRGRMSRHSIARSPTDSAVRSIRAGHVSVIDRSVFRVRRPGISAPRPQGTTSSRSTEACTVRSGRPECRRGIRRRRRRTVAQGDRADQSGIRRRDHAGLSVPAQEPQTALCMRHRRPERRCICVGLRSNDSAVPLRLEQRPRDAVSDFQRDLRPVQRSAIHRSNRNPRLSDHVAQRPRASPRLPADAHRHRAVKDRLYGA